MDADLQLYEFTPHAIAPISVGLATIVLAFLVYVRQKISRVAILFASMILFVGLWLTCFGVMNTAAWPWPAELWGRIGFAAVCFLPPSVYDFTITALRRNGARRMLARVIWAVSALSALLVLQTDVIIREVVPFSWGNYPRFGVAGLPFLIFFLLVLAIHLAEYWQELRRTEAAVRRLRIRRLITAFVMVYAALFDFLPMFGVRWYPIGWLPILAFLAYAARSIRSHRLSRITAARAADEILQTMADALLVVDGEGRIRVMNDAVRSLFGYERNELLGKPIDVLRAPASPDFLSRMIGEGTVRDREAVFARRDGGLVDVSLSISPLAERDRDEGGAVLIVRDITERKRAESALRDFTRRLQQSNRDLEEFAYVASHDLQEPLRKIRAFGDRLRTRHESDLSPQGLDYLSRMLNAAERMQTLISDLLEFSRITTKGKPFEQVDLEQIVRGVIDDMEVRLQSSGGRIEIKPLPTIEADPLQMRQLMLNLISNGLKFHRDGVPPVVAVSAREASDGGGSILLEVRDNGIGFAPEYAEKIFTIFQRLHGRSAFEGNGIGLAICRKIAQRHGGDITASATLGEGASFVVELPLTQKGQTEHGNIDHHDSSG